jgi:hypothetical protein
LNSKNQINEALKVIHLLKPDIYQQIKWYHLLVNFLKKWDDSKQEKHNFIYFNERQISKERKLFHQITYLSTLQTEVDASGKNMIIQDFHLQADWCQLRVTLQRAESLSMMVNSEKLWTIQINYGSESNKMEKN